MQATADKQAAMIAKELSRLQKSGKALSKRQSDLSAILDCKIGHSP